MTPLRLDLTPLRHVAHHLRQLASNGWTIHDEINDIRITRNTGEASNAVRDLDILAQAVGRIEAVGNLGGHTMRVRTVGGRLEVIAPPAADPRSLFEEGELEDAAEAWEGDADAALRLSMDWTITGHLSPSQLLPDLSEQMVKFAFAIEVHTISTAVLESTLQQISRYIPDDRTRLIYVALAERDDVLHLGTASFTTLTTSGSLIVPDMASPLIGELDQTRTKFPRPHCFLPILSQPQQPNTWEQVRIFCRTMAGLAFWVLVASAVTNEEGGIGLSFVGFKRVEFRLPSPQTLPQVATDKNLRLRQWTFQEPSSDRLLAIRQIVSLYGVDSPFINAEDILASAEIVYLGLRTDAITEVVKTTRDAHSQTLDTVRQALKSSQDLIKSATERFLAGLVAVGAVFIANVSRSIPASTTEQLWLIIAAFFMVLALISVLIEGPSLNLQIKHLPEEVKATSSLLTDKQRAAIINSSTVAATKRRIVIVRFAVPLIYAIFVLAISGFVFLS